MIDKNKILDAMEDAVYLIVTDYRLRGKTIHSKLVAEAALQALIKELPKMTYTMQTDPAWTQLPIEHTPCIAVDNATELWESLIAIGDNKDDQ